MLGTDGGEKDECERAEEADESQAAGRNLAPNSIDTHCMLLRGPAATAALCRRHHFFFFFFLVLPNKLNTCIGIHKDKAEGLHASVT